jgi:hypothetical protein
MPSGEDASRSAAVTRADEDLRYPKVPCQAAGMIAEVDGIDVMDLRQPGEASRFGRIWARWALGSFLWSFTWGKRAPAGEGEPTALGPGGATRRHDLTSVRRR